jgi:hypothetical protein
VSSTIRTRSLAWSSANAARIEDGLVGGVLEPQPSKAPLLPPSLETRHEHVVGQEHLTRIAAVRLRAESPTRPSALSSSGPPEAKDVVLLQPLDRDLGGELEAGRLDLACEGLLVGAHVIEDPIAGRFGDALEVDHHQLAPRP